MKYLFVILSIISYSYVSNQDYEDAKSSSKAFSEYQQTQDSSR